MSDPNFPHIYWFTFQRDQLKSEAIGDSTMIIGLEALSNSPANIFKFKKEDTDKTELANPRNVVRRLVAQKYHGIIYQGVNTGLMGRTIRFLSDCYNTRGTNTEYNQLVVRTANLAFLGGELPDLTEINSHDLSKDNMPLNLLLWGRTDLIPTLKVA